MKNLNNPKSSDRLLRWSIVAVAFLGFADALNLTIAKLTQNRQMCLAGVGDCWSVNNSPFSEIFGVPIALLGAIAYIAIVIFTLLDHTNDFWRVNAPLILFGITLTGTLYSAYLTYVELVILKTICRFCVASAIAMLILLLLSSLRLYNHQLKSMT